MELHRWRGERGGRGRLCVFAYAPPGNQLLLCVKINCCFDLIWFYLTLPCEEIFYPVNFLIYLKVKVTQLLNSNSPIIISRAPWQGIREIFACWTSECWALASGIQLKESWIPLTIEVQNPSSSEKESGIQFLKSNPRRGIQNPSPPYISLYGVIRGTLTSTILLPVSGSVERRWGGGGGVQPMSTFDTTLLKTPKKFSTIRKRFTFSSGKRIWRDRCSATNVFRFATRSGKSCQDPNLEDTCFKGLM